MLTQAKLKELLHYDPETGVFTCIISRGSGAMVGDTPGSNDKGYRRLRISGINYKAHRLAWLYTYGYFPEGYIDHINRVRDDNRIVNLREVSPSCNLRNASTPTTNSSGVKGVSRDEPRRKWASAIGRDNRWFSLWREADFTEAVALRLAAEQCFGWESCDANSPAKIYMDKYVEGAR